MSLTADPNFISGSRRISGTNSCARPIWSMALTTPGGLGVHLTLDLAGQAKFGPDVEWVDAINYDVDPSLAPSFYAAIRTYWPGLPEGALQPVT
jgi:L-2-hydroxyglutarate oxidase LhgO